MTFTDYFVQKVRSNPGLGKIVEGTMNIDLDSFRRELEKAFDAGFAAATRESVLNAAKSQAEERLKGFESFMESIFKAPQPGCDCENCVAARIHPAVKRFTPADTVHTPKTNDKP